MSLVRGRDSLVRTGHPEARGDIKAWGFLLWELNCGYFVSQNSTKLTSYREELMDLDLQK